jgi:branched-chain amino acid transport system permease protein
MHILINGLIQGLLISLLTIGFSIVYNSTGIFHIAQGAIYTVAPFLLFSFIKVGTGIPIAVLLTFAITIFLSMSFEKVNHWPLYRKEASTMIQLISSLGIYIVIIQIVAIIWGNEARVLREGIDVTYNFSGLILTRSQMIGGIISLSFITVFLFWLKRTNSGLMFTALSDNPIQLSLIGYDITKLRLFAFGLSGFFTTVAAILTALDIGFDPHGGLNIVLIAIVATIIGGRGSFVGPVICGILLGVIRSQVVWYTSARWEDTITFLLLVLFLFVRPQGIIGNKGRLEVL